MEKKRKKSDFSGFWFPNKNLDRSLAKSFNFQSESDKKKKKSHQITKFKGALSGIRQNLRGLPPFFFQIWVVFSPKTPPTPSQPLNPHPSVHPTRPANIRKMEPNIPALTFHGSKPVDFDWKIPRLGCGDQRDLFFFNSGHETVDMC